MDALPLIVGIEGPELSPEERATFARLQPAGYILFSRNIKSAAGCRALCDELRSICQLPHPPIIAIDQEGGRVIRTAALGLNLPSATALSQAGGNTITRAAELNAQTLRQLGLNTNFAPVLDAGNPHSPALQTRCWGYNSDSITQRASIWNHECQQNGIQSCGKHFPGMGAASLDPHFELPHLCGDKSHFEQGAALPFLHMKADLPSIMMAHLQISDIDPRLPSSLSPCIIQNWLRDELGYSGLIFTDDLCMGAITKLYSPAESAPMAIQAGCDLPLLCHEVLQHTEAVAKAIKQLPAATLQQARTRIANFAKRITNAPPFHAQQWEHQLQQSQQLCQHYPEPKSNSPTKDSPVATY